MLSTSLFVCLCACMFAHVCIMNLALSLSQFVSVCVNKCLSLYFVSQSVCLFLSVCLYLSLSIYIYKVTSSVNITILALNSHNLKNFTPKNFNIFQSKLLSPIRLFCLCHCQFVALKLWVCTQ